MFAVTYLARKRIYYPNFNCLDVSHAFFITIICSSILTTCDTVNALPQYNAYASQPNIVVSYNITHTTKLLPIVIPPGQVIYSSVVNLPTNQGALADSFQQAEPSVLLTPPFAIPNIYSDGVYFNQLPYVNYNYATNDQLMTVHSLDKTHGHQSTVYLRPQLGAANSLNSGSGQNTVTGGGVTTELVSPTTASTVNRITASASILKSGVFGSTSTTSPPRGQKNLVILQDDKPKHYVTPMDVLNINGALEPTQPIQYVTPGLGFFDNPIFVPDFFYSYDNTHNELTNEIQTTTVKSNVREITPPNSADSPKKPTIERSTTRSIADSIPVSNKFLAPITAAVRLKNAGQNIDDIIGGNFIGRDKTREKTTVNIEKSIPYFNMVEKSVVDVQKSMSPLHFVDIVYVNNQAFESNRVNVNRTTDQQAAFSIENPIKYESGVDSLSKSISHHYQNIYTDHSKQANAVTSNYFPNNSTAITHHLKQHSPQTHQSYLQKSIPYSNKIPITKLESISIYSRKPHNYFSRYNNIIKGEPSAHPQKSVFYKERNPVDFNKPTYQKVKPPFYNHRQQQRFAKNLRIEYGFKPPMVPSVQIDEFGVPI